MLQACIETCCAHTDHTHNIICILPAQIHIHAGGMHIQYHAAHICTLHVDIYMHPTHQGQGMKPQLGSTRNQFCGSRGDRPEHINARQRNRAFCAPPPGRPNFEKNQLFDLRIDLVHSWARPEQPRAQNSNPRTLKNRCFTN